MSEVVAHFLDAERKSDYLLPPSLEGWLPEGHLARFIVEVIEQLDLSVLVKQYVGRGHKYRCPFYALANQPSLSPDDRKQAGSGRSTAESKRHHPTQSPTLRLPCFVITIGASNRRSPLCVRSTEGLATWRTFELHHIPFWVCDIDGRTFAFGAVS